jgi:hypothetical protein
MSKATDPNHVERVAGKANIVVGPWKNYDKVSISERGIFIPEQSLKGAGNTAQTIRIEVQLVGRTFRLQAMAVQSKPGGLYIKADALTPPEQAEDLFDLFRSLIVNQKPEMPVTAVGDKSRRQANGWLVTAAHSRNWAYAVVTFGLFLGGLALILPQIDKYPNVPYGLLVAMVFSIPVYGVLLVRSEWCRAQAIKFLE